MIPIQPQNLLPQPFAQDGAKTIIPDLKPNPGRASFAQGFPEETQLPLNLGGIAPNRTDFNGMFYMLSAFAFWQQSGGLFNYKATLNYAPPSLVFHQGKLWWCVAANGPEVSGVGAKTPGSNENYWLEFLKALAQMGGGSGGDMFGNPVGTVITFWGTAAPSGYFACNGHSFSASSYPKLYGVLGTAILPDLRGYFIRGYDTRNSVDPDGASRALGSVQQDAMRQFSGNVGICWDAQAGSSVANGPFKSLGWETESRTPYKADGSFLAYRSHFDPSTVVPTATENRPRNKCLLYCIKHD